MSGDMYGAFASKLGSGASQMGKKVAQSEAGRSAGRAAIHGASEAAAKDLSNRYFGEESTPPTKNPTAKPTANSSPQKHVKTVDYDSDEEYQMMLRNKRPQPDHHKPSMFTRYKPRINLKISREKPKPRPKILPKKAKVYKYVLSRDADWESLPQALALYHYKAEMRCDLEFRKGQIIQVMTRTESQDDWWEGKIEGRVGIFPANYVKLL